MTRAWFLETTRLVDPARGGWSQRQQHHQVHPVHPNPTTTPSTPGSAAAAQNFVLHYRRQQ